MFSSAWSRVWLLRDDDTGCRGSRVAQLPAEACMGVQPHRYYRQRPRDFGFVDVSD